MRILFDIGHPAHVHLFRNAIQCLRELGHTILVTAAEKDVAVDLLRQYGIPFVSLGKSGRSMVSKGLRIAVSALRLSAVAVRFSPDILVGVSPVRAAPVAWILRRPCLGFDDTEHAHLARRLYMPFVTAVMTPAWYGVDLGEVQVKYQGLHELAYLLHRDFVPDESVLSEEGLSSREVFSVVRFVSATASHDRNHVSLSEIARVRLVNTLARHGRVLISAEAALPNELECYRMRSRPSAIHHFLAFASVYVGDAGTMTTEAALLGTPSVFYGTVGPLIGNFRHLETEYGLVRCFVKSEAAIQCAVDLLTSPLAKGEWLRRRDALTDDCIDVTGGIVRLIEACESSSADRGGNVIDAAHEAMASMPHV